MIFNLIIPTYNAGTFWQKWISSYQSQNQKAAKVVVIDSSSTDNTTKLAQQAGFFVHKIAKSDFNHGGTRNLATTFVDKDCEILVFMTQDALFADEKALENLLEPFKDPNIAAVCGRQLPHDNANPLAKHARLFNYPTQSCVKGFEDITKLGIKTAFMSNSFAAYRRSVFEQLGGFPQNTILAEDMYLTAKMILAGYKVKYCATACVKHSHNYSLKQEFQRYFDTGVFQSCEPWIQEQFGNANKEGKKFVLSEIRYLLHHNPFWLIKAGFATLAKYLGFKIGLNWKKLPRWLCIKFSMYNNYWQQ